MQVYNRRVGVLERRLQRREREEKKMEMQRGRKKRRSGQDAEEEVSFGVYEESMYVISVPKCDVLVRIHIYLFAGTRTQKAVCIASVFRARVSRLKKKKKTNSTRMGSSGKSKESHIR